MDKNSSETPPEDVDEEGGNLADRILAKVPEWFVSLGAGSLATSALISLAAAVFVGYSISQGNYFGYSRTQLLMAAAQLSFATLVQAAGVYFALERRRWWFVMLAALFGSIIIITLPFTATAFFTLGVSQQYFRTTEWGFLAPDE